MLAPVDGIYSFLVNGISKYKFPKTFKKGSPLAIDTSELNECSEICLEVFLPDGSQLNFEDEGCTYKGFKLETIIYV